MKIALCISGISSCGYSAFPYIYNSFICELDTDVYIHTWERNNPLLDLYNPIDYIIEDNEEILNSYGKPYGYGYSETARLGIGNNKDNIVSMYHSIHQSIELVKKSKKVYDVIVRLRPDLYLPDKVDMKNIISDIQSNKYDIEIPVPTPNQNYGGYHDKLLIGNLDSMYMYSDTIKYLFNICNSTNYIQAESILKTHLVNNNIRVNQRVIEYSVFRSANYDLDIHTRFNFDKYNTVKNQTFKKVVKNKNTIIIE